MKIRLFNAYILTCDEDFTVYQNGEICVDDDKIVSVGEPNKQFKADSEIDCNGDIIMPGFVCCSFNPMQQFLNKHYSVDESKNYENELVLKKNILDSELYYLTYFSLLKMMRAGITTVAASGLHEAKIVDALAESGVRGNIKLCVDANLKDEQRKKVIEQKLEKINDNKLLTKSFCSKPWFLVKESCFSDCAYFAKNYKSVSFTSASSTLYEVGECTKQFDITPIGLLEQNGFFDYPSVVENPIYVEKEDIDIFRQYDVSVCVDAQTTLNNGMGIFPLNQYLNKGINVCLGLSGDGFCFDVFKQLHLLSLTNSGNLKQNNSVSDMELLLLTTRNGAIALGLNNVGVLKQGNCADIIRISTKNFMGSFDDILHFIVHQANYNDIDFTMVNGRFTVFNGKICDESNDIVQKVTVINNKINNLLN